MPLKGKTVLHDLEIVPSERLLAKRAAQKLKKKASIKKAVNRGLRRATIISKKKKSVYTPPTTNILFAILGVPIFEKLVKESDFTVYEMKLLVIVSSYNWFARKHAPLFGVTACSALKYGEKLTREGYFSRVKSQSIKYMITKKGEEAYLEICKKYRYSHSQMIKAFKKKTKVQPENKISKEFFKSSKKEENIDDLFKPKERK